MSNSLFDKLNVLLRSKVSSALDINLPSIKREEKTDVDSLRQRINDAVDYETKLQAEIQTLHKEVEDLDRRADQAVQQNNEAMAKHYVTRIQRVKQRIEMMEAELGSHQTVAQELIDSVNRLDAAVADAQPQEADKTFGEQATERMQQVFHNAQQKIADLSDKIKSRQDEARSVLDDDTNAPDTEVDESRVEDDLAERRNRLSR